MLKLISIVFLLLCVSLGCNKVNPSDLVGTWTVDDSSRHRLPVDLQKASARMVLNANGSFTASDMPGMFYVPPGPARLESGRGVWKLVSPSGAQQVQLTFQEIMNQKEINVPYGTQLNISSGWFEITLYYSLGDPDEGRRVDLDKVK